MIIEIIKNIFRLLLFVLLQVLVFNNIRFWGYVNPYVYVIPILMLPFQTPLPAAMMFGFASGILIDIFQNSAGMHAGAAVLMAYTRTFVLKIFSPREGYELTTGPTLYNLGFSWYISYSGILIFIHHLFYFSAESFSFNEMGQTFIRLVASSVFSVFLALVFQMFIFKNKESKLS
jgi:rod shape-determining protein MreD